MPANSDRNLWPFPGLLPNRLYHYPIPSLMTPMDRHPNPSQWPPSASRGFRNWLGKTSHLPVGENHIYVHIPLCPFVCDFCPFYKETGQQKAEALVQSIVHEIELYGQVPHLSDQRFGAVYFGGGTPTELNPEQLSRIVCALRKSFQIEPDAEFTLEGVAKQFLRPGYFADCVSLGFNRISFGVQSLDLKVRREIGRAGDNVEDYPEAVALIRSVDRGVTINVELMMGCPTQDEESLARDLHRVIEWEPNSIDVYSFIPAVGTRFYQRLVQQKRGEPACGTSLLQLRQLAKGTLEKAHYRQERAEVFIKSDRHRFAPTSPDKIGNALHTLIPIGPSAIGHIGGTAFRNVCDLTRYQEIISARLLPIDRATTMTGGIARRRSILYAIGDLYVPRVLLGSREKKLFRRWERQGLVTSSNNGYALTAWGALWENQMQLSMLTPFDLIKMLPMMGSVDEQEEMISGDGQLAQELLAQVRMSTGFIGTARELAYRTTLKVMKYAPFIDRRGVGYLGTTG